ncbi:MAG: NAD-binding protein [Myxococcales bacterium]|nr:NAD-binding protein [Myxococcales bacterium]
MKFVPAQLTAFLTQRGARRDLRGLFRYLLLLGLIVVAYTAIFHVLMLQEGQQHSWLTGFYWTLTVMSTLGFGDITFHGDLGRVFSLLVLLTGIVMLLIMLPFVFIRHFYAPWLEAQIRTRAPREAPEDTAGHVILCRYDEIAAALIPKLEELGVPHFLIESDPVVAASRHAEEISVVLGEIDSVATFEGLRTSDATLVVANASDAENSSVALTVRERFADVPVVAFANEPDSVDVLELSGATQVLSLKQSLGEYLASRTTAGPAHAHLVGRFKDLRIAEFPVEHTGLSGRTIRDTRLRELTGLNIVACWERGRLVHATPDTLLSQHSIAVVVGTEDQLAELDALFVIYNPNDNPVLVIGGGKVGQATVRALRRRDTPVNLIERDPSVCALLENIADRVVTGDAANRDVMMQAGLADAPSVVLTTNDDATNIFLAVYCRRLNPSVRIVSRVTHERNLEAIHRAGADSVLSYTTLGVKSLLALVLGSEATFVGEGVDLIVEAVPESLAGRSLAESRILEETGLNVLALQQPDGSVSNASAGTQLGEQISLVMLGTSEQRRAFRKVFHD